MAFNRKSILNMQLPTESGWGLTVSIYEKNVIHGKAVMLLGHRMKIQERDIVLQQGKMWHFLWSKSCSLHCNHM